jgi:hypothetical protein
MGDELYVIEHLGAESLACVEEGLHIVVDVDLHVVTYVELDEPIVDEDCGDELKTLFVGCFIVQFIPWGEYVDCYFVDF